MFGLYATTGPRGELPRAAGVLDVRSPSPGSQHWGIVGLMLVVALGLALLLPIRTPAPAGAHPPTTPAVEA